MVVNAKFLGLEHFEDLALGGKEFDGSHAEPERHSNGSFVCLQMEFFFDGVGALLEGEIFD